MGEVRLLPEYVISKIAAGEVIQRPSSVVKELVENSLDAKADFIEISVAEGGLKSIVVRDNGLGMVREDLELCVMRHATSKIRDLEDIYRITSFGFRGEALASIAAVSKLKILTRSKKEQMGHILVMEGGGLPVIQPIALPVGTTVEVKDLFFNTPVRKKFLKGPNAEFKAISEWVIKFAFAHPKKRIVLKKDENIVLNMEAVEEPGERMPQLWGDDIADGLKKLEVHEGPIHLKIYLLPVEHARARPDRCFFYVNQRPIKDKNILKAIQDACLYAIPKGLYPQCLLFLDLPPSEIDVNIHPTKEEIKFRDFGLIYKLIFHILDDYLRSPVLGPSLVRESQEVYKELSSTLTTTSSMSAYTQSPLKGILKKTGGHIRYEIDKGALTYLKVIGQVKGLYIICETREGIYIIDQHAAHERILYEKLLQSYLNKKMALSPLIFPYTFELPPNEYHQVMEKIDELSEFGIRLKPFGGSSFLLEQIPALLRDTDLKELIQRIVHTIVTQRGKEEFFHAILSQMACQGAVRQGKEMDLLEMEYLSKEILLGDTGKSCPHGRPIYRFISFGELEKEFKRT